MKTKYFKSFLIQIDVLLHSKFIFFPKNRITKKYIYIFDAGYKTNIPCLLFEVLVKNMGLGDCQNIICYGAAPLRK